MRQAEVVASDETSARVAGKTWWQWVLLSTTAIYHVITDCRAADVVTKVAEGGTARHPWNYILPASVS